MIIKSLTLASIWVLLCGVLGCDDKKSNTPGLDAPSRNGSSLVKIELQYVDDLPKLSSDATKLVFVSGSAISGSDTNLRIYKSTWATDETPSEPELLTSSALGQEIEAFISPDGSWVVVKVASGAKTDLYLQDFEGTSDAIQITNDDNAETSVSFSLDSKFLAFVSVDLVDGSLARVLEIGTGDASAVKDLQTINSIDVSDDSLVFVSADSGYSLLVASRTNIYDTEYNFNSYSFSAASGVESASAEAGMTGYRGDIRIPMSSNGDYTMLVSRALRSDEKMATRAGNLVQDITDKVMIESEVSFYKASSGEAVTFDDPPGTQVLSGNVGSDDVFFYSILDPYKCTGDKSMRYSRGMVVSFADLSNYQKLVPRLNESKDGWEMASDYCDTTISDTVTSRIDDKITYMTASTDSNNSSYRIAYVTRFSTAFDSKCVLKTGDPEIRFIELSGGEITFSKLWSDGNQQSIKDDVSTCTL